MLASPKPLWDNCLAVIRDAVKPDQYKTWFEPIVFESYKPATKTLLLRVPSTFFYEYLEEVNRDGLSLEERLSVSYKAFTKAVAYMNTFYPDHRMDVDLLSFDADNPYYPEVLVKFPRKNFNQRKTTMKKPSKKQTNTKRKRGRPRKSE